MASPLLAQPANDNPCGAINVATNNTYVTTTSTAAATATMVGSPACADFQGRDIWYRVTVPASGILTIQTATQSGITDAGMAIYTATDCAAPSTFTEFGCNDDQGFLNFMPAITNNCLIPNSTLYIRLWARSDAQAGTMRIRASAGATPPTPPANNLPCSATLLNVGASCSATAGTNVNACLYSITGLAPSCGNMTSSSRDVWYRFVAPASGVVSINTTAGTLTDAALALYQAPTCDGPFALLGCADDEGPGAMPYLTNTSLTPGSTYWIRVWGYGSGTGTFNICLTSPAVPAGSCYYVLELFDTGENGWGASNVTVTIDGTPTSYTIVSPNYSRIIFIPVNMFNLLSVTYNVAGGPNQSQNRFVLSLSGAVVYASASPPVGGSGFSTLVDCAPPPAVQQDCIGGYTVCNGGQFSNNAGNAGYHSDLHPGNRGCLSQNERQGTWYFFSPQASGIVGFTVANGVNVDYDFAVWGPMPVQVCPPTSQPIRCSYAAPPHTGGYSTGLASPDGTDLYEGASGNGWVMPLTVTAGEVYLLYVDNFLQNNQPFQLTWNLSSSSMLDCSILPLELLMLSAHAVSDDVLVSWTTHSESGISNFLVEHSTDGINFTAFASVRSRGPSSTATDYQATHMDPMKGYNYYRIRSVHEDGTTDLSSSVPVRFGNDERGLVIRPNPAVTNVWLDLPQRIQADTRMDVRLTDATGRVVHAWTRLQSSGSTGFDIPIADIEPGTYVVQLFTQLEQAPLLGRFVKQ
jgi:hypothetical protein